MFEEDSEKERIRLSMLKDKTLKSFIKVGNAYIDIKDCFSFSFEDNPDGYVFIKFRSKYDMAKVMKMPIDNRNDLSLLFLELENFFDDPNMTINLNKLMDEVENLKYQSIVKSSQATKSKKQTKTKKKDE